MILLVFAAVFALVNYGIYKYAQSQLGGNKKKENAD